MVVHCAICGRRFEAYKGRAKYCPHCRGEIENLKGRNGSFKEVAEYLAFIHEEERALNMNTHTIEEVVELGKEYDLSYGYMTAKLEGRI